MIKWIEIIKQGFETQMKKLILKTAFITLGVALILIISVFGIVSFCAPKAMMALTASLGLESISGDYAYQEYQQSSDIDCLARSFEIAAENKNDLVAYERFEYLYAHEQFDDYCNEQGVITMKLSSYTLSIDYRCYVCARGACVQYRVAKTDEEKAEAYLFAVSETNKTFTAENPVFMLALEAAEANDKIFCTYLLENLSKEQFEENDNYLNILTILEEVAENE